MIDRKGAEKLGKKACSIMWMVLPSLLPAPERIVSVKEIRAVVSAILDNFEDPSARVKEPTLWESCLQDDFTKR